MASQTESIQSTTHNKASLRNVDGNKETSKSQNDPIDNPRSHIHQENSGMDTESIYSVSFRVSILDLFPLRLHKYTTTAI